MNYKRGKPKSKRAGCLWCKPHKAENVRKIPRSKRAQSILSERIGIVYINGRQVAEIESMRAR